METTKEFKYISATSGRILSTFPFRVGDLVMVTDWGESYSSYKEAFKYFGLWDKNYEIRFPFYATCSERRRKENKNRLFKIMGVVEHRNNGCSVFYIKDNENRESIIGGEGLKPFKVFPLRPGETNEIKINKLK